jgi:hypothetical protein
MSFPIFLFSLTGNLSKTRVKCSSIKNSVDNLSEPE